MRPLLLALFCLPLACAAPDPKVWSAHGVAVRVTEIRAMDNRYADYRIEVSDARNRYCFASGALGNSRERRGSFSEVIQKDAYIFVPASCGGGNASKCRGYQAFATTDNLKWLGHITGRWDGDKVVVYEDGVFFDTGDMLEINDLLSHAESPRYALAYTYNGRSLVFDPARSWSLNAEAYATAQPDAPGLLYRAGLAKLCGQAAELKATQAVADKVLNQKGRQLFKSSLAQVKPDKLQPQAFIPVGECPPAEKR